jgi:hypothetical protein
MTGEQSFRCKGFKNWKAALEKKKGLLLHESSSDHVRAMALWTESDIRQKQGKDVNTLLNETQLTKNRYYVSVIFDIVRFLVINDLAFRGDSITIDCGEEEIHGLFLRLFEFTLKKDKQLADLLSSIPKVATYRSPRIQNEVISLMAQMVQENIAQCCNAADVKHFTLKVDGTRDQTGQENISIVVRFVKEGEVREHLLSISSTIALHAEALTDVILTTLKASEIDPLRIISQCYDGASVMSGRHGGVQAILQNRLNKTIPYVHCSNHKLHLVVVNAVSQNQSVSDYFDICSKLYCFTRKPNVAAVYKGTTLKRLMEHRWTGHLETTRV